MKRSALTTEVVTLRELFDGSGSRTFDVAVTVLVKLVPPGATTSTVTVIVCHGPDLIAGKLSVTVPFVPTAGPPQVALANGGTEQETKFVPGGSTSVTVTSGSTEPKFMTAIMYVSRLPVWTALRSAARFITRMSAEGLVSGLRRSKVTVLALVKSFAASSEVCAGATYASRAPSERPTTGKSFWLPAP